MYPGQWIHTAAGKVTLWSPWFPRAADDAIFTYEEMVNDGGTLVVKVFGKDTEEPGDGTEVTGSSFSQISGTNFYKTAVVAGMPELVRFRYELTRDEADPASVLFRMLSPTWFDQAT